MSDPASPDGRFLVFRGPSRGQGVGRTMFGLAAALALGTKHDRRVCVRWRDFDAAFEQPAGCPHASSFFVPRGEGTAVLDASVAFELWSFDDDPELASRRAETLLDSNATVIVMEGDGGGSRGGDSPGALDFPWRPTPALAALLSPPRRVVIHLRVGDGGAAAGAAAGVDTPVDRRGLFRADGDHGELALQLANLLPRDALLLTDSSIVYEAAGRTTHTVLSHAVFTFPRCTAEAGAPCVAQAAGRRGGLSTPEWGVLPHSAERHAARGAGRGARVKWDANIVHVVRR